MSYGSGYGLYGGGFPYGLGYGTSRYGLGYGVGYPYYGYGSPLGAGYPNYGTYYNYYGSYPSAASSTPIVNYSLYYTPATTTSTAEPTKDDMAHLLVVVPENAELWFNGTKTKQAGKEREFVSPALTPGKTYSYEVKASWMDNGKKVEKTRTVDVKANDWKPVDFTKSPSDAPEKDKK